MTDADIQVPGWFIEQSDLPMQVNISNTTSNASVSVISELPSFPSVVCSIVLNSEPTAEVTISLESTDDIHIDPNTTKFTSKYWSVPRFVIVAANDDDIAEDSEEPDVLSASAHSEDQYYIIGEAFTLNSTVMDNDEFTVVVTMHSQTTVLQGAIQLYESSSQAQGPNTGSYLVSLGAIPSSEVTTRVRVWPEVYQEDVTLTDIDGNLVDSLTFDAATWNVQQRIIITAVDDCQDEGTEQYPDEFLLINSLSSEGRSDVATNVSVVLTDDDEIELPRSYIMHGPRAGPLTGNTTVTLTAVVEDEAAFGTNLRAGMIIRCRFTDEYGIDSQTAGFVLNNDGPYPSDTCVGSAEVRCVTPTWSVEAEGELVLSRHFSCPFFCVVLRPRRLLVLTLHSWSEQCPSKSVLEVAFTWASTLRSSTISLRRPPSLPLCLALRRVAPLSKCAALRLCRPTRRSADLGAAISHQGNARTQALSVAPALNTGACR